MICNLLLALILVETNGAASPDGGPPPPQAQAQTAASKAQTTQAQTTREQTTSDKAQTTSEKMLEPAPASARDKALIAKPKTLQNSHVPLPYSERTTNPSLDASRSTVVPDREALPQELQGWPLAPLGPAPPDTTPTTEYGSGPRRVQDIHSRPGGRAPNAGAPGAGAATPPAAPAPDPRRTP
jgi:hypothetical protein